MGEVSALAAADICKYGDVSQMSAAVRVYVRRSRRTAWLSLADEVDEGQVRLKVLYQVPRSAYRKPS